jgi:Dolichyl-phosphate-mannose-protein mannosyltransferase
VNTTLCILGLLIEVWKSAIFSKRLSNLQHMRISAVVRYLGLLLWLIPLLILNSGHNSLMAHDEGLYAWRSRQMFDSGDWINPWMEPHHKTPGIYWLIACVYKLFAVNEFSVRLPSAIAGIFSVILLYEIGKIILNEAVAWLAAAIFSVEFLWLQYCRLGTPDVPMVCLILLGIMALLKAELNPKFSYLYGFIAGLSFSLGLLIRGLMIFVPIVALLPYLIWEHRRHRHLSNPIFYIAFCIGLIPTCLWLLLNWQRFGINTLTKIIDFFVYLSSQERDGNGIIFYFWNVPIKAFPWSLFSLLGLVVALLRPIPRYQLILVGCPLMIFTEVSLFPTRLSHYSLSLYPFIALLAAVGLNWLGSIFDGGDREDIVLYNKNKNLPRNLSYVFGVLGIILLPASIIALCWGGRNIHQPATVVLALSIGWLILPSVYICRYHFGKKWLTSRHWIGGWLIAPWLALAVASSTGLLGDYNPNIKAFLQQPAIAPILQTNAVYSMNIGDKTGILLDFYTPKNGKRIGGISELPPNSYAWIPEEQVASSSTPYRVIARVEEYLLVYVE